MSDALYAACEEACNLVEGEDSRTAHQVYMILSGAMHQYNTEKAERTYNGGYTLAEEMAERTRLVREFNKQL